MLICPYLRVIVEAYKALLPDPRSYSAPIAFLPYLEVLGLLRNLPSYKDAEKKEDYKL